MNNLSLQRKQLGEWLQQSIIIFTGAGISFSNPAAIPTANKINMTIWDHIYSLLFLDEHLDAKVRNARDELLSEVKMETYFEVFKRNGIPQMVNCFNVFSNSLPNIDHLVIALLCKTGLIKAIFTLNFDNLHEKALSLLNVPYKSLIKDSDFEHFSKSDTFEIPIFHLHNGIDENYKTDLRYLNTTNSNVTYPLPKGKDKIFREYLQKYPIMCAGYSNNDFDTIGYITIYSKKIIWYSHFEEEIEPLGAQVQKLKNNNDKDFLHIIRNPKILSEYQFADVIENSLPLYKEAINELRQSIPVNGYLLVDEKIHQIKQYFIKNLQNTFLARIILSDLFGIITKEKLAIELLEFQNDRYKNLAKDLIYYRSAVLRHCYEQLGKMNQAIHHAKIIFKYAPENKKIRNKIILSSSILGKWKRQPYNLILLLRFELQSFSIRKQIYSSKEKPINKTLENQYHFDRADLFDYIGNYLFYPSVLFARFYFPNSDSFTTDRIEKFLNTNFLSHIDKIIQKITRKLTSKIIKKALRHYETVQSDFSKTTGTAYLCLFRSIENLSFLGEFTSVKEKIKFIENGRNYFNFTKREHGLGNLNLALYVYNKCRGDTTKSTDDLWNNAWEQYGKHYSGLFKGVVLKFRFKNGLEPSNSTFTVARAGR